jgi:hypothetical protein
VQVLVAQSVFDAQLEDWHVCPFATVTVVATQALLEHCLTVQVLVAQSVFDAQLEGGQEVPLLTVVVVDVHVPEPEQFLTTQFFVFGA